MKNGKETGTMIEDSAASAETPSRRAFLKNSTLCLSGLLLSAEASSNAFARQLAKAAVKPSVFKPKISAHLWVYASAYPRPFDATPVLDQAFRDLHLAGYDGIEVMEVILRHDDAVERLSKLVGEYQLPVTGSSYGAPMWDATKHDQILADATVVVKRLSQLKAETFGISVGDAGRVKTDAELD